MSTFIHHLTIETAVKLARFLDQPWPPQHIDRAAHDHRMKSLEDLISREGGALWETATGWTVNIGGVRATYTSGLIGATRNWINAVRKKSAKQTGAA